MMFGRNAVEINLWAHHLVEPPIQEFIAWTRLSRCECAQQN